MIRVKPNSHVAIVVCMHDLSEIEAQDFNHLVDEIIVSPAITKVTLIKADTLQRYSGPHLQGLAKCLGEAKKDPKAAIKKAKENMAVLNKKMEEKEWQHLKTPLSEINKVIEQSEKSISELSEIKGDKSLLSAITNLFEIQSEINSVVISEQWSKQNTDALEKLKKKKTYQEKSWNDFRLQPDFEKYRQQIDDVYNNKNNDTSGHKEFKKTIDELVRNFFAKYKLDVLDEFLDKDIKDILFLCLANYVKEECTFLKITSFDDKEKYNYEICQKERNSAMRYIYKKFCNSSYMKPLQVDLSPSKQLFNGNKDEQLLESKNAPSSGKQNIVDFGVCAIEPSLFKEILSSSTMTENFTKIVEALKKSSPSSSRDSSPSSSPRTSPTLKPTPIVLKSDSDTMIPEEKKPLNYKQQTSSSLPLANAYLTHGFMTTSQDSSISQLSTSAGSITTASFGSTSSIDEQSASTSEKVSISTSSVSAMSSSDASSLPLTPSFSHGS